MGSENGSKNHTFSGPSHVSQPSGSKRVSKKCQKSTIFDVVFWVEKPGFRAKQCDFRPISDQKVVQKVVIFDPFLVLGVDDSKGPGWDFQLRC